MWHVNVVRQLKIEKEIQRDEERERNTTTETYISKERENREREI